MTLLKDPDTNTRVRHDPWREILCGGTPLVILLAVLLPWENHPWFGHPSEVSSNSSSVKAPGPKPGKKPGKKPEKTHPVRPVPTITGDPTPTPGEPDPSITVVTLTPVRPTEESATPEPVDTPTVDPEPEVTPEDPVTVEPAPTGTPGSEVSW